MTSMPAIPGSTRDSIITRLNQHARQHWPQLDKVQVSYRSQFAYAAGILGSNAMGSGTGQESCRRDVA